MDWGIIIGAFSGAFIGTMVWALVIAWMTKGRR